MAAANVEISVGTILSVVSGVPATENQAGYEALSWIVVGEVTNFGDSGGTAQITTFTPVGSGIVHKRKGSKDYGTMALSLAKDASDVGQIALKAGFDGANEAAIHSCRVVEQGGEATYFQALVGSFTTQRGDANTIISHTCNLERTGIATVV